MLQEVIRMILEAFFWLERHSGDHLELNTWYQRHLDTYNTVRPHMGINMLTPSSPSEDYLAVLAGQRQWIATTNCAGCPGRPPDSFANSAVLTTSAKFLMRWAGP